MRTETLLVTRRCNQQCRFCDRVDNRSIDPGRADLENRIDTARARGAEVLTLSGGEPLLRTDLAALVAYARRAGFDSIALETNATRLDPPLARELADAGLTRVQASFLSASTPVHQEQAGARTRPGLVLRGLTAALDAGLETLVRLPLARELGAPVGRMLGLAEAEPRLRHFVLAPIGPGEHTVEGHVALDPVTLAAQLDECAAMARRRGLELELDGSHPVAPCALDLPRSARRLLASQLTPRETANDADPACGSCALRDHCALDASALGRVTSPARPLTPIGDATEYLRPGKSPGSRLHVLGAREVPQFFHVDYEYDVEVARPTSRIGIIYRCNQVCTFCELADMNVKLDRETVEHAITSAFARGSRRVILTGGEPTLCGDLEHYVRHARALGFEEVELQTNAVLLADAARAERLAEAGLTSAQISLHGPDAAVSDRLTAAPGTHAKTLLGVGNLLSAGVRCLLNHLIFRDNCERLEAFIELLNERYGAHKGQIVVQFHSPRNEFVTREEARAHIPRYSEYAGRLTRAVDRGRALGFTVRDLQDPTGIPALCVLGADETLLGPIRNQGDAPRFHAWESEWLTHAPRCSGCSARGACMGIPKYYLDLYGDEEFVPFPLASVLPA